MCTHGAIADSVRLTKQNISGSVKQRIIVGKSGEIYYKNNLDKNA